MWNQKPKVAPAELAEALLNEFVAIAGTNAAKSLTLDESARARFDEKARSYAIASLLIALAAEEPLRLKSSPSRYCLPRS